MSLILVVDDDRDVRELIVLKLNAHGFDVESAADGDSALALCLTVRPDLVVLDVMMPGLSGLDVARVLRTAHAYSHLRNVPVLMLTAMAMDYEEAAGLAAGADVYLTKPFSPNEMLDVVQKLLPPSPVVP